MCLQSSYGRQRTGLLAATAAAAGTRAAARASRELDGARGYTQVLIPLSGLRKLVEPLVLKMRSCSRCVSVHRRWPELVEDLLLRHYDPGYRRSAKRRAGSSTDAPGMTLELPDGSQESYRRAAEQLLARLPAQ